MVNSVLVVDDDAAFLGLAARVLEKIGVEVVLCAPDAAAGGRLAEAQRPAAALVDVDLPDAPGVELARRIAALPWRPRVVLTSADRDAGRALDANGDRTIVFVPKEELAEEPLRRLLDTG
ncbi:MAG TPA: response regulator [Solirubrobacterales bacterium]